MKKISSYLGLFFTLGLLSLGVTPIGTATDIEQTLTGVESGLGGNLKTYANIGIGILLLIWGALNFFGNELARTGRKWFLSGFLGAIVIVNYEWIKNTLFGWIGG